MTKILGIECKEGYGTKTKDGYYLLNPEYFGEQRLHRYIYVSYHHEDIEGLEVRHLCHNPGCIEITHLTTGTHEDNMRDMRLAQRGRGPAKLTEDDIREIRRLASEKEKIAQTEIAELFGITNQQVSRIVRRVQWKWVN